MSEITRKGFELKVTDEAQGLVQAIVSTFDVVDRDGDIITAKAFARNNGKHVFMVASHDWDVLGGWIGDGTITVYPDRAEFDGKFWLDTIDGEQAFRKVKNAGGLCEWSHGFEILERHFDKKDGRQVQVIDDLDEFEVSPVLVGAGRNTETVAIKAIKATWDTAYIDALPDSAFAVIDENGRHLPHHGESGAVDVPHLRNALSREPQTNLSAANHAKAKAHLDRHARAEGIDTGDDGKAWAQLEVALDHIDEKAARMGAMQMDALHAAMAHLKAIHGATCDAANCPVDADDDTTDTTKAPLEVSAVLADAQLAALLVGG